MRKNIEEPRLRPAVSPEEQEMRCIGYANDLVEKRLKEGTATSQEIVYFLKLGSPKEKLAIEREQEELKLIKAKTESLQESKNIAKLYSDAINAMMLYSGNAATVNEDEDLFGVD